MMKATRFLQFGLLLFFSTSLAGQAGSGSIRLNQLGYFPNGQKLAAVIDLEETDFQIKTPDLVTTVFEGQLGLENYWPASEENVRIADFTIFSTPGEYVLTVGSEVSLPFRINENVFNELVKGTLKAFYFNRASTALLAEHAGVYARPAGHPDIQVVVHPSAATAERPAGTIISTPGGWYDAGDYNKYIVNSGISTFTLLSAYETYPEYYDTLTWNIPQSNNDIPDILDEAYWNIAWMATMQDSDGGVYNKTTTANFAGIVMPNEATAIRYVAAKGTAATLDFAAIMAMAARIYADHYPDFAQQALEKAELAWEWAKANPNVPFNNPGGTGSYPPISTGGYGDTNFADEFSWAATELYITTLDDGYYAELDLENDFFGIPGWPSVETAGLISLVNNRTELTAIADTTLAKERLIEVAESSRENASSTFYRIPAESFGWGSNSDYANRGMLLMHAFRLTGEFGYFSAAVSALDYLLGRNATAYSFVTGFGSKTPKDIHHRQSGADEIEEPVPGFLVGGPNPGNTGDCGASAYPSTLPAKAYVDLLCSYSTNEVTINWNAPIAFLSGALQYEYLENFTEGIPDFFDISSINVVFPSAADVARDLSIYSNINWMLTGPEWVNLSMTSGSGSGVITVSSTAFDLEDSVRAGYIYILQEEVVIDSILVTQNGVFRNFLIQGEDFKAMSGIQTETTTDLGGGLNIGFVDIDDWVEYDLDISSSGTYDIEFRHAGQLNDGDFDISIDGEFILNISTPSTGGWQNWQSTTVQVCLETGLHTLRLDFNQPAVNINWMRFEWVTEECLAPEPALGLKVDHGIRIFPNPTDGELWIKVPDKVKVERVAVISMDGQTVLQKVFGSSESASLQVGGLPAGTYLLQAYHEERLIVITKILVK